MKTFVALFCTAVVASSSASPYSEEYVDYYQGEIFLTGGDDSQGAVSSQSFETSDELALITYRESWRQAALDRTNELRKQGGQPPLTLNGKMSNEAQEWAERIKCSAEHSPPVASTAENLAGVSKDMSQVARAVDGVNRWYGEIKDYTCRSFTSNDKAYYKTIGHYYNMMNRQYNAVGFGMAMCDDGSGQLVARFGGTDGFAKQAFFDEMKKQGKKTSSEVDKSAFVNCQK